MVLREAAEPEVGGGEEEIACMVPGGLTVSESSGSRFTGVGARAGTSGEGAVALASGAGSSSSLWFCWKERAKL